MPSISGSLCTMPLIEAQHPASLTLDQFADLSKLLRLRAGPAREAVKQHLVNGITVADAARSAGLPYPLAFKAVERALSGLDLARGSLGLRKQHRR